VEPGVAGEGRPVEPGVAREMGMLEIGSPEPGASCVRVSQSPKKTAEEILGEPSAADVDVASWLELAQELVTFGRGEVG
jgi:hypothetical protein